MIALRVVLVCLAIVLAGVAWGSFCLFLLGPSPAAAWLGGMGAAPWGALLALASVVTNFTGRRE